jgi:hypothetical protein
MDLRVDKEKRKERASNMVDKLWMKWDIVFRILEEKKD